MKIRIEGCTQQEFDEKGDDLTVGKEYPAQRIRKGCYVISDDAGDEIWAITGEDCPRLPADARWVEVSE